MLKRSISLMLVLAVLLCCAATVSAVEPRANEVRPTLSFVGTIAVCSVSINRYGKQIEATMELWSGSTLVRSWSKTGTSVLSMTQECPVSDCVVYTLKVHGTIGGVAFEGTPVSGTV